MPNDQDPEPTACPDCGVHMQQPNGGTMQCPHCDPCAYRPVISDGAIYAAVSQPTKPTTLPAITIWQPWASLIAGGAKPFEWRGWEAPRRFWGRRIAIHAGARKIQKREIAELILELRAGSTALTGLVVDTALPLLERWHTAPGSLPLSSVLCTATLDQPITARQYADLHGVSARDSERIDHQKWGWPLTDIQVLNPYIPATGAQGFWNWNQR